jgi:RecA/RadA recombinase
MLRSSDTTLMVLNQIRERVGVMFGPTEITTSGRSTEFLLGLSYRNQKAQDD